jgi:hypothetical protein
MMIPVLLKPPAGRPARVLGKGRGFAAVLQNLSRVGWPVEVHDPDGGPDYSGLPGVRVVTHAPPAPALRQASLVLIGASCPADWRSRGMQDLEGSGVPVWDESDPSACTLAFPMWMPGQHLSLAAWASAATKPWERGVVEDFLRHSEGFMADFLKLVNELRTLIFNEMADEAFREKVATQLTTPEILGFLLKGDYEKAKMLALKIVGSTTRSLGQ